MWSYRAFDEQNWSYRERSMSVTALTERSLYGLTERSVWSYRVVGVWSYRAVDEQELG